MGWGSGSLAVVSFTRSVLVHPVSLLCYLLVVLTVLAVLVVLVVIVVLIVLVVMVVLVYQWGLSFQIVLENYAFPGLLLIGTDSHTPNGGM